MHYISTRGHGPVSFTQTLLDGLAPDGGLYLPESYPQLPSLNDLAGVSYEDLAFKVMQPYVAGEIDDNTFKKLIKTAYSTFSTPDITPLVEIAPEVYVLELFHGPTLAFKDIALQLLGLLLNHTLTEHGRSATVIGATSGDTGPAAINALAGLKNVDVFMLYPHERTSPIQQRQMTTINAPNIHVLAVDGTFDDCQTIVKTLLSKKDFREKTNATAINSISWARLMPQIVYYISALLNLKKKGITAPITFSVPTGNFGDIFAGYVAKRMAQKIGLPMQKLVIATNTNDILYRFIHAGDYSRHAVTPTHSPSMDIQMASNFERLLFDAHNRDTKTVTKLLHAFHNTGTIPTLTADATRFIRAHFCAGRKSDDETLATLHDVYERYNYLADPHTAVGLACGLERPNNRPLVCLATAHPAKFPEAVEKATGHIPPMPDTLHNLMHLPEHKTHVQADVGEVERVVVG